MIVNSYYIDLLLLYKLAESGDDDDVWPLYEGFDKNSIAHHLVIINRDIVPFFEQMNIACKENIEKALRYYLYFKKYDDLYQIFSRYLIAFEPSDKIDMFFELIYKTLFPNKDFSIMDEVEFILINDWKDAHKCFPDSY